MAMIPCEECLILPLCRHKYFLDLRRECSSVYNYLYDEDRRRLDDFDGRLDKIYEILKPTNWSTGVSEDSLPFLRYKKPAKKSNDTTRVTLIGNAR